MADAPMPLLELKQAARTLQRTDQPARLSGWRQHVLAHLPAEARLALDLIPPVGWSPTFIGPPQAGAPKELIEQVRATTPSQIQMALTTILPHTEAPSATRHLTDPPSLARVCDGLSALYDVLLAPYWPGIVDAFTADRSVRMRQVLHGGVEQLLSQANPREMSWNSPTLEVITRGDSKTYDLHLEGRGLLLVPSMMLTRPVIHYDAEPQPAITYPAIQDESLRRLTAFAPTAARHTVATVTALLGNTRAAVLTTIAEHPGCSTKEVAALARLAPSSASEHATVLREAGLITTTRYRNTALHSPTHLGLKLLNHSLDRPTG